MALEMLGERESRTEHLQQAADALRLALQVDTRERMPGDWATIQLDLGVVLFALGERESGTEHLQQAADAFRLALQEDTRERVPLDWAMIQMGLGNTLLRLASARAVRNICSRQSTPISSRCKKTPASARHAFGPRPR